MNGVEGLASIETDNVFPFFVDFQSIISKI
jgi:hypothetical protein